MSSTRTHLLVPMHVDALTITSAPPRFPFVNLAPQYKKLRTDFFSASELKNPLERITPEKGIHLHFRLPSPAAHASSDGIFPRIPNRWLVQRYYTDASGKLNTRAWLIRGDQRSTSNTAVVLPVLPESTPQTRDNTPLELRPTGTATAIDTAQPWTYEPDTPAEIELTAISGGDAGFSAHYPACRGILGFYDDLDSVPAQATLSYFVTGWYSTLQNDPWSQLLARVLKPDTQTWSTLTSQQQEQISQWLSDHRCARDFTADARFPEALLFHGLVQEIQWNANSDYRPAGVDPFASFLTPGEYWIDIGNSSADAFAARSATLRSAAIDGMQPEAASAARDIQEDLVTGLQTGILSERYDFSGLDAELHRQSFASTSGPLQWSIQSTASTGDTGITPRKAPPLSPEIQTLLSSLNQAQQTYDDTSRRLRDYQWELYAVWFRRTFADRDGKDAERDQLTPALNTLKNSVPGFQQQTSQAATERDAAKDALNLALQGFATSNPGWNFTLESQPGPSFYAPRDPVLLLSGPAMQNLGSEGKPNRPFYCRITGEELKSFTYDETTRRSDILVDATTLTSTGKIADYLNAIPAWSSRLFVETLLLDELSRRMQLPGTRPASSKPREGVLPDPVALFRWKHNPWKPVYVYWEVDWTPSVIDSTLPAQWTLDIPHSTQTRSQRNTDLLPVAGETIASPSTSFTITGYSFPSTPLAALQAASFSGSSKGLLDQINTRLRSRISVMLSAVLGGFHDALLARRAGDQLIPLDYSRWFNDPQGRFFPDPVIDALGPQFHADTAPANSYPFSPVRMGSLRIRRVRVVDLFGQYIDLPLDQLSTSNNATTPFTQSSRLAPHATGVSPAAMQLYPRICQPTRVQFQGQQNPHPLPGASSETPVRGWVVPNRLEQHLALYTANGRPAGILQRLFQSNLTGFLYYWVPVPGINAEDTSPAAIADPTLRDFANFVLSLNADEGNAFAQLLQASQYATEQRIPEGNSAVSDLIGRPLALVQTTLHLQPDALFAPNPNESWRSARDADAASLRNPSAVTPLRVTGDLEATTWSARLGDKRDPSDGLIGFFQGTSASGPFYTSRGFDLNCRPTPKLQTQQTLAIGFTPQPVTLLMDPQARVHITTGILPRTFFQLSGDDLANARQIREVFFQTAPVLGPQDTPQIPKPSDDYGQWSWTYRPNVTFWKENPDLNPASDRATLPIGWPAINEGWLRLRIDPVRVSSFWLKSPAPIPLRNSLVTLAWAVQGATRLALYRLDGTPAKAVPVQTWNSADGKTEYELTITKDTIFELRAFDEAGYEDRKRLEIKVTD